VADPPPGRGPGPAADSSPPVPPAEAPSPSVAVDVRSVLLVAAVVVGVVLAIAAIGTFVPPVENLFGRLPIAIIVLVVGTAWVLWRIAGRPGAR